MQERMKHNPFHSLKTLTVISIAAVILITFAIEASVSVINHERSLKMHFMQTIMLTADKKAMELNACFSAVEGAVKASADYILRTIDEDKLMTDPEYEKTYTRTLIQQLKSLAYTSQNVVSVYFHMNMEKYGSDNGILLEGSSKRGYIRVRPPDLKKFSPTDMEHVGWYYIPIWTEMPVWTDPYENKNTNMKIISYIIPMYRKGELLGVVGMDINLASIKDIIDSLPQEGMLSLLVGKSGSLLYYNNANLLQKSVIQSAEITDIMHQLKHNKSGYGLSSFYWDSVLYYGLEHLLDNDMKLIMSISSKEINNILYKHVLVTGLSLVLTCIMLALLLMFSIKTIINPIRIINKATTQLSRGELNISIPYKSNNELGQLAESIRKMSHQMQEYIEYIREQTERERKAKEEALTASSNKTRFLASMYTSLHEMDLNTNTFMEVHTRKDIAEIVGNKFNNARETIQHVMERRIKDESAKKDFMNFIDFSTLEERMKDKTTIAKEFYSVANYWCRARFILIDRNQDGTLHHVMWAVENINDEYTEREKLRNEAERNAAASQAKSAFLANMSHEIRTPINAVLGMNEMILREANDKTVLEYASNIKNAGASLLEIVNEILDFSKIEAGKMELLPENYDISSIVIDLVNMISGRAKKKNLAFNLNIDPTLPKTLHGDSIRIKQCAINLLTNAVKYTKEGSVTFTVTHSRKGESKTVIRITVKDTGMGIKKEDMNKLFSPFERIEEGKNKTIEGSGLGMSIVTRLLDMMNSKLEVKSEYNKGSEFSFSIEQEVVDWTEIGDINTTYQNSIKMMQSYKEKLHAPKAHLLFVDDTEMNLEVIKGFLKKTGIKLDTVTSGKEALEKARQTCYDIMFIDHRMPDMDGIETLHELKAMEDNKSLGKPCIALTANAISGVRKMYIEEGFTDYLSKPVNPDKLEDMIRQYLPQEYLEDFSEEERSSSADSDDAEKISDFLQMIRSTEGIDEKTALVNCGTEEILKTAIVKYHASIEETCRQLQKFFDDKDWKNYGTKVHGLKSTSRLIGATELSSQAEHLEHCADREEVDEIKAKHPALMSLYKSYTQKLAAFVPEKEEEGTKLAISTDKLKEKLNQIAKCAEDFDINGLDDIIKEIAQFETPDEMKDLLEKVKTCIDNVDFKGIRELLANRL